MGSSEIFLVFNCQNKVFTDLNYMDYFLHIMGLKFLRLLSQAST